MTQITEVQLRRGTAAVWTANNPTLFQGEIGLETDTLYVKIGDGVTAWNALSYWLPTLAELANYVSAALGAGLVGYSSSLSYGANTIGYAVKNLALNSVSQAYSYWTTAGTATSLTLTPSPALGANNAGTRYNVKFNQAASSAGATLSVSGLGALPLMQYNAEGTLVTAVIYANQISDVVCDGTHWVLQSPVGVGTVSGGKFRNLIVTYGQSSGAVQVTADEVTVSDLNGNQTRLLNVNTSATLATTGAIGGTDGSALTAGNMYTVWVAYNPNTGLVNCLISAEPTSPTTALLGPATPIAPYTQYACVSINKIKALAPAYWQPAVQRGNKITWTLGTYLTATPVVVAGATGSTTTPTYTPETVVGNGNLIPYHSAAVSLLFTVGATASMIAAPNLTGYGAILTGTVPPYMQFDANSSYGGFNYVPCDMPLESAAIGVAQTGGAMFCVGAVLNL